MTTTLCRTAFTPRGSRRRRYGLSLFPNALEAMVVLNLDTRSSIRDQHGEGYGTREPHVFEDDYADGETTGAGDVAADVADDVVDDVVAEIAAEVAGDIIAAKKVDPLRVNPTGIGDRSVVGDEGLSQAQRVLASAVNDYYKNLTSDQGLSPELPDINQFVPVDNRLRLKNYPDINLTNARTGRPNTLGYIAGHWKGGGEAIRQDLGFPNWSPKLSAAAAAALHRANQELGKAAEDTDNVELQDI